MDINGCFIISVILVYNYIDRFNSDDIEVIMVIFL